MPTQVPAHIEGLLRYLSRPEERANEDLALAYFRHVYPDVFTRQEEASRADGYVPGSFVLELKGQSNRWLTGLLQGLAYKNKGLDFSQIVVGAKNFLAVWRVADPLFAPIHSDYAVAISYLAYAKKVRTKGKATTP